MHMYCTLYMQGKCITRTKITCTCMYMYIQTVHVYTRYIHNYCLKRIQVKMLKKILLRAYRINSKWIWFLVSHSFSREDSELRLSTSKNDTVVARLTTTFNIAVNKKENGGGGGRGREYQYLCKYQPKYHPHQILQLLEIH